MRRKRASGEAGEDRVLFRCCFEVDGVGVGVVVCVWQPQWWGCELVVQRRREAQTLTWDLRMQEERAESRSEMTSLFVVSVLLWHVGWREKV